MLRQNINYFVCLFVQWENHDLVLKLKNLASEFIQNRAALVYVYMYTHQTI